MSDALHSAPRIYVVAAPSGAGKSTLCHALLQAVPGLAMPVSHTTREPRSEERDGVDYHFVSGAEFERLRAQDQLVQTTDLFGYCYGTSRGALAHCEPGTRLLIVLDWRGAQALRRDLRFCESIFILPPDWETLRRRMQARGDSAAHIEHRMQVSEEHVQHSPDFDYVVVNDSFEQAVEDLAAIVRREGARFRPQKQRYVMASLGVRSNNDMSMSM